MTNQYEVIEERLASIQLEIEKPGANLDELDKEIRSLTEQRTALDKSVEERKATMEGIANGTIKGEVIKRFGGNGMEYNTNIVKDEDIEVRSFQKYLLNGTRNMTDTEERALNLVGSAAVLPTGIYNKLITSDKYSDLLSRATVITENGPGKLFIPIASNNTATWKDELAEGTEKSPTLTKLELGGYELMRLLEISAAASSMTTGNFENTMLQLLQQEIVETLENSLINGTGTGQPKGLSKLTYTTNTNQILTTGAAVKIKAENIAKGISLLPQRYSRNAIILCNSDAVYQISQFLGTSEYAYDVSNAAVTFLGKPIIVSEHVPNNEIYILDPKECYIRFSLPIQVEADRSAGFTKGSTYMRALTVVDAVFNTAAVVRVGLGS